VTVDENAPDTVVDLGGVFQDVYFPNSEFVCYMSLPLDASTTNGAGVTGEGLRLYTFFVNDAPGEETTDLWSVDITFTSPDGSGIFNLAAFSGFLDVDQQSMADLFDFPTDPHFYNKDLDTWLAADWLPSSGAHLIHGPAHEAWIPQIRIMAASGVNSPSGEAFLQVVTDGNLDWAGDITRGTIGSAVPISGTTALGLSVEGNTNPGLVTASIESEELTLSYAPGASGSADVTVRATDSDGAWVQDTFTVTVNDLGGTEVVGRHIFYNRSAWDANDPSANADDDSAIATDKQALLPGEAAVFANYTSYSRGINGIMIDVDGMSAVPSVGDFVFRVGNDDDPSGWSTAAAPINDIASDVRNGAGADESDRITIIWSDNAIEKQWLEITVLSDANSGSLGLGDNEVFYFGNAIGETGNVATNAIVNAADEIAVRNNPAFFPPATLTDVYDLNRDKTVGAADQIIARNNTTFLDALKLITVPGSSPEAEAASAAAPVPTKMGTGSVAKRSGAEVPVPIFGAESVSDGQRGQAPSSFDTLRTAEPVPFVLEPESVVVDLLSGDSVPAGDSSGGQEVGPQLTTAQINVWLRHSVSQASGLAQQSYGDGGLEVDLLADLDPLAA